MTDASSQLLEKATYCKSGDELRPLVVGLPDFTTTQVCPDTGDPDPVSTAYPDGWYVRIMFDELLDPSFEDLTPVVDEDTGEETGAYTGSIAASHPVKLECRSSTNSQFVEVDYDGYYSPSGNRVTWPVGPSIVIKPNDPTLIATNTECQVTLLDVVTDKQGNAVPEAQRGPFSFKVAPITVVTSDPPVDDPTYEAPIDAVTVWYDNLYIQFNTTVDVSTLCPDDDGDGLCNDDSVFSIKDVEHPTQGPGYCNVSFEPCGQLSDCPAGMGDTVCGKGYCGSTTDPDNSNGDPCNTAADCSSPDDVCGTTYAYDYVPYGGSSTEFGIGPANPLQTDRKYIFSFTEGAKIKDRCGVETTLGAPSADDQTLAHFVTNAFDLNSTTILTGEVPSATKRLEFDFNNVLQGSDSYSRAGTIIPSPAFDTSSATPAFTISPLPKKQTAPCPGGGAACPLADLTTDELLIVSPLANGQAELQGHLAMNTEYTATLKAGTVVKDFYGATWTNDTAADMVIKWKTQPAIQMTGIAVRNTGQAFSVGNNGTLTKDVSDNTTDVRISFNASIDPTTFDLSDVKITTADGTAAAIADLAIIGSTGCADGGATTGYATGWYPGCTLRMRGTFPEDTYKITVVAGAKFKDVYGTEYTQAADSSITVNIAEAVPTAQCL